MDHHISSREQITLQDNMEGVVYSTSKFGLDGNYYFGYLIVRFVMTLLLICCMVIFAQRDLGMVTLLV